MDDLAEVAGQLALHGYKHRLGQIRVGRTFQAVFGEVVGGLIKRVACRAERRAADRVIAGYPRGHDRRKGAKCQQRQHQAPLSGVKSNKQEHRDNQPAEGIARQPAQPHQQPRQQRQAQHPARTAPGFTGLGFDQHQAPCHSQENHQQQHGRKTRNAETPEQLRAEH